MGSLEHIDYSVTSGRAEIILDRPDVMNAFNESLYRELNFALEKAIATDDVRVIVLSGNGRAFSAGRDLNQESPSSKFAYREYLWLAVNAQRLLYEGPKPSIAAVNGPALGAGFAYTIASDFRIMSTESYLNDQHVNVGLAPGCVARLLAQLIGESAAKQYLLTGKDITPEAAKRLELAYEVVEPEEVLPAARRLADELTELPVEGVRQVKAMSSDSPYGDMEDEFERHWRCITHPEHEAAKSALRGGD